MWLPLERIEREQVFLAVHTPVVDRLAKAKMKALEACKQPTNASQFDLSQMEVH